MSKYFRTHSLKLVFTFLILTSCLDRYNSLERSEEEWINWFNSFNPKWRNAIQTNDASYIINLYHEDAIIGVPNKEFIVGKPNIENYWNELVLFLDDFSYKTQKLGGNPNDMLYENGIAIFEYNVNNIKMVDTTKYLFVWKHIGNKEYRIYSEMYNAKN